LDVIRTKAAGDEVRGDTGHTHGTRREAIGCAAMSEYGIAAPAAVVAWYGSFNNVLTAAGTERPQASLAAPGADDVVGIALCSCLMECPPGTTRFHFLIWMALGLAICAGCSVQYSRQAKAPAS
jgi:hypothetical protein